MLDSTYTILIDSGLDKILKKLPEDVRKVFNRKLEYFKSNPNHPSLNTKPYQVSEKFLKNLEIDQVFEFYINRRDYRCILYVSHLKKEVIIAFIGNHTQISNRLK